MSNKFKSLKLYQRGFSNSLKADSCQERVPTFKHLPSSAAQGGGGSFRTGNQLESLGVVDHGWQGESKDGLKGGWSCALFAGMDAMVAEVPSPTAADWSVAYCGCPCSCWVVELVVVVVKRIQISVVPAAIVFAVV